MGRRPAGAVSELILKRLCDVCVGLGQKVLPLLAISASCDVL
jgi:hypothetical protein